MEVDEVDSGSGSASASSSSSSGEVDEKVRSFEAFIDLSRLQLKRVVSVAPPNYHAFGQIEGAVTDLASLLEQSRQEWAKLAPDVIYTLLRWFISITLYDMLAPRLIGTSFARYVWLLASGTEASADHFTEKQFPSQKTAEDLSRALRVLQDKATAVAQIILNIQQAHTCVLPYIWHFSCVLKRGGTTNSGISELCKFNLSLSPSIINKEICGAGMALWYSSYIGQLMEKARATIIEGLVTRRIFMPVYLRDNLVKKLFYKEQRLAKSYFDQVVSCTTQVAMVKIKPEHVDAGTCPLMTRYTLEERNVVNEMVQSQVMDLKGVLVGVRHTTDKMSSSKFFTVASDDMRSASHADNAIGLDAHGHLLGVLDEETGEMKYPMIVCVDTEFILIMRKMCLGFHRRVQQLVVTPPPFHAGMHINQIHNESLIWQLLVWFPFCLFRGIKPSLYNAELKSKMMELVTDAERINVVMPRVPIARPTRSITFATEEFEGDDELKEGDEEKVVEEEKAVMEQGEAEIRGWEQRPPSERGHQDQETPEEAFARYTAEAAAHAANATDGFPGSDVIATAAVLAERYAERKLAESDFVKEREVVVKARGTGWKTVKRNKFKLSGEEANRQKTEDALSESLKLNYARMLYNHNLFYAGFTIADDILKAEGGWQKNELTQLIHYMISEQLSLGIQPFVDLQVHGDLSPLLTKLPLMITAVVAGGREFVVRALVFALAEIVHLRDHCPGMLKTLGANATYCNELPVEHKNGRIVQLMERWGVHDYDGLREMSVRDVHDREGKSVGKTILETGGAGANVSDTKQKKMRVSMREEDKEQAVEKDSEFARLVRRFLDGGSERKSVEKVAEFLVKLVRHYGNMPMAPGISTILANHRILDMQAVSIDEMHRRDEQNIATMCAIMEKEQAAVDRGVRVAAPVIVASTTAVDEFTYYLANRLSTLDKILVPVFKKKMELEAAQWAAVYKAQLKNKSEYVAAIRNMFGATTGTPDADALVSFKQFCETHKIPIIVPKVPWHFGILPPPTTIPPESMASAFNRAPGLARSIQMNTTLDTSSFDSIYKRPL